MSALAVVTRKCYNHWVVMLNMNKTTTDFCYRLFSAIICTVLLGAFIGLPARAVVQERVARVRKVVLIVLPAVSLDELAQSDLPNIHKLMNTGAVGLMNARTAGLINEDPGSFADSMYTPETGYVTLGAGSRTVVGFDARNAYNRDEIVDGAPAGKVLQRLTLTDPKSSEVVHTDIVSLTRDVSGLSYESVPGLLGSTLHAAGLKTAAVGNSDSQTPHREIATISMDRNGLVDFGDVGSSMVTNDPTAPYSSLTNTEKLLSESARCIKLADFTAIELGDLSRMERTRLDLMDNVFQSQRTQVLAKTDKLLGKILGLIDLKDTELVVVSPYPASYVLETTGNSLCPIIVTGPGYHRGCLTSGSTRVNGAVVSIDIAPSILEWLGVPPSSSFVGRAVTMASNSWTVDDLLELQRRITLQNASQSVLQQSAVVTIVLVIIITALWFILPADSRFRKKVLPVTVLLPTVFALSMLLMGALPTASIFTAWVCMLTISVVLLCLAMLLGRTPLKALMIICLAVSAGLMIDVGVGGPITKYSVMSYSVMEGARYYGLGNEFMGTLIGASLVGIGLLLSFLQASDRAVKTTLVCGLVLETAAIGFPELGANVGGAIAVLFGFGFALAATSRKGLDIRKVCSIVFGVAAVIALFAVFDSLRGPQHESHLGRAVSQIRSGGFDQMAMIIKRKMSMNIMLISCSSWSRLSAVFAISAAAVLKVRNVYCRLQPISMYSRVILAGAISGTLAALFFNDSGIVAAGTSLVYLWALILLMASET